MSATGPEKHPATTSEEVRLALERRLGRSVIIARGPVVRVRRVSCSGGVCTVEYNAELPVFGVEESLLAEQPAIWEVIFGRKEIVRASVVAYLPVGRKDGESVRLSAEPALRVECERRGVDEVDWSSATGAELKRLCRVTRLLDLDVTV